MCNDTNMLQVQTQVQESLEGWQKCIHRSLGWEIHMSNIKNLDIYWIWEM